MLPRCVVEELVELGVEVGIAAILQVLELDAEDSIAGVWVLELGAEAGVAAGVWVLKLCVKAGGRGNVDGEVEKGGGDGDSSPSHQAK